MLPPTFRGDGFDVHLPRPSSLVICLSLLLPACSAVLDAPRSTFRAADTASPLQSAGVFEAPAPQRGARFGDKVALDGTWLAVTAPFETAAGDAVIPPDAPDSYVPDGEGVSYLIDTAHPENAAIRVIAPNADHSDCQVPKMTLTYFIGDSHVDSVPAASIALDDDWLVVGAAGEDSALSPDHDADAAQADNSAADAGAVYIYSRAQLEAGDLTLHQYLKAPKPRAGDLFGLSVALSGSQLVVGAPGDDSTAADSGAVYVFALRGDRFELRESLKASPIIRGLSGFGASLSLAGERLVIGAPGDKDPSRDANDNATIPGPGAAYVYRSMGDHWQQEQVLLPSLSQAAASFGWSVRATDDRVVVGSPFAIGCDEGPYATWLRGAAHVFHRDPSGWALDQCLNTSGGRRQDFFGYSVGISDSHVLIGAAWDYSARSDDPTDGSAQYTGAVYLEEPSDDHAWRTDLYLKAFDAAKDDVFGNAIDVGSEWVAIGAEQRSHSATYAGSVYLYRFQSATNQP